MSGPSSVWCCNRLPCRQLTHCVSCLFYFFSANPFLSVRLCTASFPLLFSFKMQQKSFRSLPSLRAWPRNFRIIQWRCGPTEPTEKSSFRVLPTTDPNALAARRGRNALPFRFQACRAENLPKTRAIRIFGAFGSGLFFLKISEQTKARAERGPSYRLSWFVMAAVPERRYRACCPVRPTYLSPYSHRRGNFQRDFPSGWQKGRSSRMFRLKR